MRLHEQWVELDPNQVDAAESFLGERRSRGEMSFLQALRMAQSANQDELGQATNPVDEKRVAAIIAQTLSPDISFTVRTPRTAPSR